MLHQFNSVNFNTKLRCLNLGGFVVYKMVGSSTRLSSDQKQYFIEVPGLKVGCVNIGSVFKPLNVWTVLMQSLLRLLSQTTHNPVFCRSPQPAPAVLSVFIPLADPVQIVTLNVVGAASLQRLSHHTDVFLLIQAGETGRTKLDTSHFKQAPFEVIKRFLILRGFSGAFMFLCSFRANHILIYGLSEV